MSVGYRTVQWSRPKRTYDLVLAAGVMLCLGTFVGASFAFRPGITAETAIIRGTALTAFLLLHGILAIGPLARLDRRFLPLLFNRRHAGVAFFLLALVHAAFAIVQFHALGDENPLVSALGAYSQDWSSFPHWQFEVFGFLALLILFLMAATSHDFWNRNLGPSAWKTLHLGVLAAYGLLVLHVAYGVIQSEGSPVYLVLLAAGALGVFGLHGLAGFREAGRARRLEARREELAASGFEPACRAAEVAEGRGLVVDVAGERRAVFRHQGRLFGLSNVCCHQGGPLGEGQIFDGCVTCPWHGWQYRPEDGVSPPPFEEKVPTYALESLDDPSGTEVWMAREALPLETVSPGLEVEAPSPSAAEDQEPLYVNYLPTPPALVPFLRGAAAVVLLLPAALAALVAGSQEPFDEGVFEFGIARTFEGVLHVVPLPRLARTAPVSGGEDAGDPASIPEDLLLAGFGKHGLPDFARGHGGARVRFEGSLIQRRDLGMVEMNAPETFQVLEADSAATAPADPPPGRAVLLEGELVDSKCFLGVMRPATGKVHRGCAVRCLSGGVPPALLVRSGAGAEAGDVLLLTGPGAEPLSFDPGWAARRVRASGTLGSEGEIPVLRVSELTLAEESAD